MRALSVLGHDAFEAELAGALEDDHAVTLHVLVELDAGRRLGEQRFEPCLARVQGLRSKVLAIKFQQVEGAGGHAPVLLPAVQGLERREAVGIATFMGGLRMLSRSRNQFDRFAVRGVPVGLGPGFFARFHSRSVRQTLGRDQALESGQPVMIVG
jgi:hypothetical protein